MNNSSEITFESGLMSFSSMQELQRAWESRQWELNSQYIGMHRSQEYDIELAKINAAWKQYFRQLSGIKS
jgi:hypothetical protein